MTKTILFKTALSLSTIFCLVLAVPAWAKGKSGGGGSGSKSTNVNVTTTVYDYELSGTELLMRSDDSNGSGQAAYSSALNAGVLSEIDNTGRWRFELGGAEGVRTLWITPNDPIDPYQPAGDPAGYYWQSVEVYSGCRDQNGNIVPFQNIVTSSGNCSLGADFNVGGTVRKLFMGSVLPGPGPATGLVTVTCNSVSLVNGAQQCVKWTIAPNTGAPNPTVANLYSYWSSRGKAGWTFIGQYFNTFRIDATNP
jgi:hypothetical protein